MSTLFTTVLHTAGENIDFIIRFEGGSYHFAPIKNNTAHFSLIRKDDEWHCDSSIHENLKAEVINALDNYLLAQH